MATDDKDIRKLLGQVDKLDGWRVERRSLQYVVFPPKPGTPFSVAHGPGRPRRALAGLRSKLRRNGVNL